MKRKITTVIGIVGLSIQFLSAQLDNVTQILQGGLTDANKLAQAYMEPYGKGFALGLSNGWYNIASTHKTLGFDLTFSGTVAMVPTDLKTYDVRNLGLTTLTPGANPTGPTIAGSKTDGADLTLTQTVNVTGVGSQTITNTFKMPKGVDVPFVPSAMAQLGVGIPFGTDVMIRFLPTIKIGDFGKLGLWGVGLKHDIKQWIPGINKTPFWSMSLLVGYTSFKTSVTGEFYKPDPNTYYTNNVDLNNDYKNQGVELSASALNVSLLVSSNIKIINIYGGLGIVSSSSKLILKGKYGIPDAPDPNLVAQSLLNNEQPKMGLRNVSDPLNLEMSSKSAFKATIGLRIKLAIITLHADYSTCDGYGLATAGLGFSFR
ncbi:MAG: hypothetical protein N2662_05555 [Bacteroidales bacterium]|nr:hypothetical protein [Bacteroidales bacterium]